MHKSDKDLQKSIEEAKTKVIVGGKYFHYKKSEMFYIVRDIVILEASDEPAVLYQAEYGEKLSFVRSVSNWLQKAVVDGKEVERFTKVF